KTAPPRWPAPLPADAHHRPGQFLTPDTPFVLRLRRVTLRPLTAPRRLGETESNAPEDSAVPPRFALCIIAVFPLSAARSDDKPDNFPAGNYIIGFGSKPLTGPNRVEMKRSFHLQPGQFVLS